MSDTQGQVEVVDLQHRQYLEPPSASPNLLLPRVVNQDSPATSSSSSVPSLATDDDWTESEEDDNVSSCSTIPSLVTDDSESDDDEIQINKNTKTIPELHPKCQSSSPSSSDSTHQQSESLTADLTIDHLYDGASIADATPYLMAADAGSPLTNTATVSENDQPLSGQELLDIPTVGNNSLQADAPGKIRIAAREAQIMLDAARAIRDTPEDQAAAKAAWKRAQERCDKNGLPVRQPYAVPLSSLFTFPIGLEDHPYVPEMHADSELGGILLGDKIPFAGKNPSADPAGLKIREVVLQNLEAFCYDLKDLKGVDPTKVDIDIRFNIELLKGYENKAVVMRDRNFSMQERQVLEEHNRKLLEYDFIERAPPGARHCLSSVVAPKKDSSGNYTTHRVCLNTVQVNAISTLFKWQTLSFEDVWRTLAGATVFSRLDMRSGYYQLPVTESTAALLSFSWNGQIYRYKRMPFGPKSAPAFFQQIMDTVFAECAAFVTIYIDDVVVFSRADPDRGLSDVEVHAEHLERVLKIMKDIRLLGHPEKTCVGCTTIELLGHLVSPNKISPSTVKTMAIMALKVPTTKLELQSVLGLANYYRAYLPSFSKLARPLFDLLSKQMGAFAEHWTDQHTVNFEVLKRALCRPGVCLRLADPALTFSLHTDWSCAGIGAVLTQDQMVTITHEDGTCETKEMEVLISAISRSLNVHEARYSSWEGETLCVCWAVRTLRYWLSGQSFIIYTDCRPLLFLNNRHNLPGSALTEKHRRWAAILQEYDFVVRWRKGTDNVVPDVLSRHALPFTKDFSGARVDHVRRVPALPESSPTTDMPTENITRRTESSQPPLLAPWLSSALANSPSLTPHALPSWESLPYGSQLVGPFFSLQVGDEADLTGIPDCLSFTPTSRLGTSDVLDPRPYHPAEAIRRAREAAAEVWHFVATPMGNCYPVRAGARWRSGDANLFFEHHLDQEAGVSAVFLGGGRAAVSPTFRQLPALPAAPHFLSQFHRLVSCIYWDDSAQAMQTAMARFEKCARTPSVVKVAQHTATYQMESHRTNYPIGTVEEAIQAVNLSISTPILPSAVAELQVYIPAEQQLCTRLPLFTLYEISLWNQGVGQRLRSIVQHRQLSNDNQEHPVIVAPLIARPAETARWHQAAFSNGVFLIELCGGISTALEALLWAGFPVKKYVYSDCLKEAQMVSKQRHQHLLTAFPHLMTEQTCSEAFTSLPMDINQLTSSDAARIHAQARHLRCPILVVSGWPCTDLSRAGKQAGLKGYRSRLIEPISIWIAELQDQQAVYGGAPCGYFLENVAFQTSQKQAISDQAQKDFRILTSALGDPICFDAAAVGAGAHRLRNMWTNLGPADLVGRVFHVLHDQSAYSGPATLRPILDQHHEIPVASYDDFPPYATVNQKGRPLNALPTLMSMQQSRAFRPGRQGCLLNTANGKWEEPSPEERERALGLAVGCTNVPGVSPELRHFLLGNSIDLGALSAVIATVKEHYFFTSLGNLKNGTALGEGHYPRKMSRRRKLEDRILQLARRKGLAQPEPEPLYSNSATRSQVSRRAEAQENPELGQPLCSLRPARLVPGRQLPATSILRKQYGSVVVDMMLQWGHRFQYALGVGPHVLEPYLSCSTSNPCSHCAKSHGPCRHLRQKNYRGLGYEGPCKCPAEAVCLTIPVKFVSGGIKQQESQSANFIFPPINSIKPRDAICSEADLILERAILDASDGEVFKWPSHLPPPPADTYMGICSWDTHLGDHCRRSAEFVRDFGGRGLDPFSDHPLLRHLQGTPLHEVSDDLNERRRVAQRAPAYRWEAEIGGDRDKGRLLRVTLSGNPKVVPPPDQRRDLVRRQHELSKHLGVKRTIALLTEHWYWHNLDADVRAVLGNCTECKRRQTHFGAKDLKLHSLPICGLGFRWSVDLLKLPITKKGQIRCLIAVEHLARFLVLASLPDKDSSTVAIAFQDRVISIFGIMAEVLSDGGSEFAGSFHDMLESLGISHRMTSTYHPASNGLSERCVGLVKRSISKMAANYRIKGNVSPIEWNLDLAFLALAYNCSPQSSIRVAPSVVMFAQKFTVPPAIRERWEGEPLNLDATSNEEHAVATQLVARAALIKRLGVIVVDNLRIAQQRDQLTYARRHSGEPRRPSVVFAVGDWCYTYRAPEHPLSLRTSKRPYRIIALSNSGTAKLQPRVGKTFSAHISTLAPCHLTDIEGDSNERLDFEDTICSVCQSEGNAALMLLCEHCNRGKHLPCFNPPLLHNPPQDWYCEVCVASGDAPAGTDINGFIDAPANLDEDADEREEAVLDRLGVTPPSTVVASRPVSPAPSATQPPSMVNNEVEQLEEAAESPASDPVCDQCEGAISTFENRIVLCETCNCGRHQQCFSPPVHRVPRGAWFCPTCLPLQPDQPRFDNHGFRRRRNFQSASRGRQAELEPLGTTLDQPATRRSSSPASTRDRQAKTELDAIFMQRIEHLHPLSKTEFSDQCTELMPGLWPQSTLTHLYRVYLRELGQFGSEAMYPPLSLGTETDQEMIDRSAQCQGLVGSTLLITMPSEIRRLASVIDLSHQQVGTVLDPWAGTCTIEAVLSKFYGAAVLSNDYNPASPAPFHLDSLRAESYDQFCAEASKRGSYLGAIVCSPHWALMDVALPLALQAAAHVVCLHVSSQFFETYPARRRAFMDSYARAGLRLDINLAQKNTSSTSGKWVILFKTPADRLRLCHRLEGGFTTFEL